jgi:hypothetical protein
MNIVPGRTSIRAMRSLASAGLAALAAVAALASLVGASLAGCGKPPTPAEVCGEVCRKLASCDGAGPAEDCYAGFQCSAWQAGPSTDCEVSCLGFDSCSAQYDACRSGCVQRFSGCAPSCGACGPDERCYGGVVPGASFVAIGAMCVRACTTTDDCGAGEHCVLDARVYGQQVGRVCLPTLATCDQSVVGACVTPSACDDPSTLRQVYLQSPAVCGAEFVHCPNGCEVISLDGGSAARCRP